MTRSKTFSVLLWLVAMSFAIFAMQSGDVFMYLSLARDFIFSGQLSQTHDPYLYSLPSASLVWTHEYLSYVVFAGAFEIFGVPGLILLKALVWSFVFVLTLWAAPRERNAGWLWVGLWLLAVLAGSFRFIERSSMFSDAFSVWLVYYLVDRNTLNRKMIMILTFAFLLWIQLHPGFAMGILLLLAWTLYHTLWSRHLKWQKALWLLLPLSVLCINPEGWRGFTYPFEFALHEAATLKKYNFEWMPSYSRLFRFAPETCAFWLLSLTALVVIARQKSWTSLRAIFALIAMAVAIQAVRFVPWASFAILLCIKPWCELKFVLKEPRRWQAALLGVALLLLAGKNFVYGYRSSSGERLPHLGLDPKFFPIKTEEFIEQKRIPGNLYNTHDFGSYLVWKKNLPIFHHGFVTDMKFYENDVMGVFHSQQRFLELASKYNWTMLLVDKYGSYRYFYQILAPLPNWKIVAEDEASYLIYLLPN